MGEDRKVDLIVMELKRYDVKVAALQETKWCGCEVYHVGGSVVLTAGRKRLSEDDDMYGVKGYQLLSWAQRLMHGRELGNSGRHGV